MNKFTLSLIAFIVVPLMILVVGISVVAGAVVGISASIKSSPAGCNIDAKFFDDFNAFENFVDQGGCQAACAVTAGTAADGTYTEAQLSNLRKIIGTGQLMNVPEKGAIIGIATALVESGLKNYANDGIYNTTKNPADKTLTESSGIFTWVKTSLNYSHDAVGSDASSVGLFQQQAWWGTIPGSTWQTDPDNTMKRLMDPYFGAQKFYNSLLGISGWESMDSGSVAQKVQVSANPGAYSTRIVEATQLYNTYKGEATPPPSLYDLAGGTKTGDGETAATICGSGVLPLDKNSLYQITAQWGEQRGDGSATAGSGGAHRGMDIDCGENFESVYSMVSGTVVIATSGNSSGFGYPMGQVSIKTPDGILIEYLHGRNVNVSVGDLVSPGQPVMECASTGPSTGTHLHINFVVTDSTRGDVIALPEIPSRPGYRDPALGMELLGVDICPPYTADRKTKSPGAAMPSGLLKCWPKEEWVR